MWDDLWINLNLATMDGPDAYGAIEDGALAVADGRIAWLGAARELDGAPASRARRVHDGGGRWMTPGLSDCHTHLVYGGNRAREFELRLEGASYAEIARAGGGIVSTVAATRAESEERLLASALTRVDTLRREPGDRFGGRVMAPGDPEKRTAVERSLRGIPLSRKLYVEFRELSVRWNVPLTGLHPTTYTESRGVYAVAPGA